MENTNKIYYFYPNKNAVGRRITVAGVVIDNNLHISHSIQNPKDIYNKELGRKIARERAIVKPRMVVELPTNKDNNTPVGRHFFDNAVSYASDLK